MLIFNKKERDMRKLAVVVAVALALGSCGHDKEVGLSSRVQIGLRSGIQVVKFEGHSYLAYDNDRGGSLCHSETCPCKSK
jgi:hypothetical protein